MKLDFTVERLRGSVTQGEAAVWCNGVKLIQYGDTITMNGEYAKIGNWGSKTPDEHFINATLYPCKLRRDYYPAEVNAIEHAIKDIIDGKDKAEIQKSLNWIMHN